MLKKHHDAKLQMRDNTQEFALRDVRARVNGFDAKLQDLHPENQ